jgi:predicted amidohydrolase YtcJ
MKQNLLYLKNMRLIVFKAIGDKANRAAVDAFQSVLGSDCEGCNEARRLRIEHAQIIVSLFLKFSRIFQPDLQYLASG